MPHIQCKILITSAGLSGQDFKLVVFQLDWMSLILVSWDNILAFSILFISLNTCVLIPHNLSSKVSNPTLFNSSAYRSLSKPVYLLSTFNCPLPFPSSTDNSMAWTVPDHAKWGHWQTLHLLCAICENHMRN